METIEGGCHCGRVRFRATVDLDDALLCNCSMCTKKGFIHLIIPPERFQLLSGGGELMVYRFNTGVAQHQFCRNCGVHPFYVPRSDPDKIDVNARCLDGISPTRYAPAPSTDRTGKPRKQSARRARRAQRVRQASRQHEDRTSS